jgi:hypothetical protein
MAEAGDLKSPQCGFDSRLAHDFPAPSTRYGVLTPSTNVTTAVTSFSIVLVSYTP